MPDCAGLNFAVPSTCLHADTLFACNAYHIGKERCYFGGALACEFRIFASPARQRTLRRLDLPQAWLALLVDDVSKADVIISDRGVAPPQLASLQEEVGRPVVGFQCTGALSLLYKGFPKRCTAVYSFSANKLLGGPVSVFDTSLEPGCLH